MAYLLVNQGPDGFTYIDKTNVSMVKTRTDEDTNRTVVDIILKDPDMSETNCYTFPIDKIQSISASTDLSYLSSNFEDLN